MKLSVMFSLISFLFTYNIFSQKLTLPELESFCIKDLNYIETKLLGKGYTFNKVDSNNNLFFSYDISINQEPFTQKYIQIVTLGNDSGAILYSTIDKQEYIELKNQIAKEKYKLLSTDLVKEELTHFYFKGGLSRLGIRLKTKKDPVNEKLIVYQLSIGIVPK